MLAVTTVWPKWCLVGSPRVLDQRLEHVRGEVAAADAGVDGVDQLLVLGLHAVDKCAAPGWQYEGRFKCLKVVSSP